MELYREGRLSLGKAAELAGAKSKWEMRVLLSERGVPLDYTAKMRKMTCGRWKQYWADDRRLQLHALDSLGEDQST